MLEYLGYISGVLKVIECNKKMKELPTFRG